MEILDEDSLRICDLRLIAGMDVWTYYCHNSVMYFVLVPKGQILLMLVLVLVIEGNYWTITRRVCPLGTSTRKRTKYITEL